MEELDHLRTVKAVADRLAISTRTVRRLIESGDLTAIRVGPGSVRVRESDLTAFIQGAKGVANLGIGLLERVQIA